MNLLLVNIPSRRGKAGFVLPLGLLYVGSIIKRRGHNVRIIDPYLEDINLGSFDSGDFSIIDGAIREDRPAIVGYGGISTSYGRAKRLSRHIRDKYPEILQIAGGALSSVYELLLSRGGLDAVFHGEAEVSLPIFLSKVEKDEPFHDTPGISYLSKDGIKRNPLPEQIKDLDTIPLPSYDLIEVSRYLSNIEERFDNYDLLLGKDHRRDLAQRLARRRHYIPLITARGCTHRCSFCYRHVRGFRQHSVGYVVRHIRYLKEAYGIEGFNFSDELFNANTAWVAEFSDALERERLNIFYLVAGARVDKMSEALLRRLKDSGCIEINYGQESGSDTILKEYGKGASARQNREVTGLTSRKVGIHSTVQLVIGSPGESPKTIAETIRFLKDLDAYNYSLNYLIPLPETLIWNYVQRHNLVRDLEGYLDLVAEQGGAPLVNLTKFPDKIWRRWSLLIRKEMNLYYYKKTNPKLYYYYRVLYFFSDILASIVPAKIIKRIPLWLRRWYWSFKG